MMISFRQLLTQIRQDRMLIVVILSPIATGAFFKFGLPIAEDFLCGYFEKTAILSPYYLLFDLFLAAITPYMFCFTSAMTILEDRDTNIINYFSVTPVGKAGYLCARLVFPTVASAVFSVLLLLLFSLSGAGVSAAIVLSMLTAPIGLIIALLIVSLSTNKVEGMAFAKLGGLIMFGVVIPFFITGRVQYFGAFLPSFWVAKSVRNFSVLNFIMEIAVSAIWILLLYKRFSKRIR